MKHWLRAAAAILGLSCLAATAGPSIDPAKLIGNWRNEQSGFAAHGTTYFVFSAPNACAQVAKATILGGTKWATIECQWSVDGDTLTLTITASPSDASAVGKVQKTTVSVSAETLTLTDGGHSQVFTRVTEIPPEFAAKLPQLGGKPETGH
jgi:hypothetical protein